MSLAGRKNCWWLAQQAGHADSGRLYSGTLGRVDNCQLDVFLGYAANQVRLLIDRALYLSKV